MSNELNDPSARRLVPAIQALQVVQLLLSPIV